MKVSNYQISAALILSAAAALIYEVTTTQILFLYFIESSYSLSIVLSSFLLGLGLGSFGVYKYLEKLKDKRLVFGVFQLVISTYAFFIFTNLSVIIPRISTWGILVIGFLILLFPAIFIGAIFPLSFALYKSVRKEAVGLVYAVDLAGAVMGSMLVGLVLIPNLGIVAALIFGSALNLISAFIILPKFYKIVPLLIGLIFLSLIQLGFVNLSAPLMLSSFPGETDISKYQFYRNSPFGAVAVINNTIYINGREQCSLFYSEKTSERTIVEYALNPLQSEYPQLNVLNIGLGCGLTVAKVLSYQNIRLDVAEINPTIVEANKAFTDTFQKNKFNLYLNDGLNYLRNSDKKYQAIIIDVEDPTVIHSSNLYTVEAYKIVSDHLDQQGIFGLWTYEPGVWADPKTVRKYLDVTYYSLRESFKYVYWYPRVFIATNRKLDGKLYTPQSAYEVNTLNHNTVSPLFDGWYVNSI